MLRERKDQCDLCDYNGVRQLGVLWMVVWLFQGSVCLLSAPSQGGGVLSFYILYSRPESHSGCWLRARAGVPPA